MTNHEKFILNGLTFIVLLFTLFCFAQPSFSDNIEDIPIFPQIEPNDPDYNNEYFFYSFIPVNLTPRATDPDDAAGMSVDIAWEEFGIGREDVVIAYVEGGMNWFNSLEEIADKIYINMGELPELWCSDGLGGTKTGWPACDNGDDWFNAPDFKDMVMDKVGADYDQNSNGILDAEDLILIYSNGIDEDENGYVDDISGWDFYHNRNNPAIYDTKYTHANGQMKQAAAITNNNVGGAGICPRCMLLPVKAGAEALDRTDDLAKAWLFAADAGADIIVSTTADLGYSTFIREAIDYITRKGVVIVEASNDFNSTDHQGGMFHANVLPGNGLVPDTQKLDSTTKTFRSRSCITSWGTQNMFSASNNGGTTSESTPTVGGVMAIIKSAAEDAYEDGLIDSPVSGFELIQVVRDTIEDVKNPDLNWAGKKGWDLQYGYGRPNVYKAISAIHMGRIPPVALIDSPRWFTLIDPTRDGVLQIEGRIKASRADNYTWELQIGAGPEPEEGDFIKIIDGNNQGGEDKFKKIQTEVNLDNLRSMYTSFYDSKFAISKTKELATTEQYTVTLRLQVTDNRGIMGEDRRSIFMHHDPSWQTGFPKPIGYSKEKPERPGGAGQACLVDLQGKGNLAIVFGDCDGYIHAIDGITGEELSGWPTHTLETHTIKTYDGVNPRYEPIFNTIGVGDLDHDGNLWVVATSSTGRTYVFDDKGELRVGWPRVLNRMGDIFNNLLNDPNYSHIPMGNFLRLPVQGATAPPVLFDLDLDGDLEIIQAGWDGYLHIFHSDGSYLFGWPKKVELPEQYLDPEGYDLINDQKIDSCPVIADLDGDGDWEIVVRTQYFYQNSKMNIEGISINGRVHVMAYHHDGRLMKGWPAEIASLAIAYGTAQEFITEGSNMPVAADVDGDGDDEVMVNPLFSSPHLIDGDASIKTQYLDKGSINLRLLKDVGTIMEILGKLIHDHPVGFTTTGAFGKFDGSLSYAQSGSGIMGVLRTLVTPGEAVWLKNYERAYDVLTGKPKNGFPSFFQGLNFLGAPVIADVTGDGKAEIIDAGDSSALHAYSAGGNQAEGFPKFTSGWVVWSPSIGDLDSDGDVEIVALTREGYLMVWDTPGLTEANNEWWHFHHDEWNSGRYGTDTRPPGVIRDVTVDSKARTVQFTAPGDDWYSGKPSQYYVTYLTGDTLNKNETISASVKAGDIETFGIPENITKVNIRAEDDAGNLGRLSVVNIPSYTPDTPDTPAGARVGSSGEDNGFCFISTTIQ